jgi:outer membrane immunogenic protein
VKKFVAVVAAIAAFGFVSSASAADMPAKAPAYKAAPMVIAPSWAGFYIGANVGVGRMTGQTYTFADPGNAAFASCGPCIAAYNPQSLTGSSKSGLLGGIHFGYNWQFAPMWLAGVEADAEWANLRQSVNNIMGTADVPVVPGSNLSFETKINWLASLRGRVGVIQNNWLFYATGGVAWADLKMSANASCPPPAIAGGCVFTSGTESPFSVTKVRTGFVVGGGLEWQMPASQWRARGEYLFYGFNSTDSGSALFTTLPGGAPLPCINTPTCSANYTFGKVNVQTARIGLSYAFH